MFRALQYRHCFIVCRCRCFCIWWRWHDILMCVCICELLSFVYNSCVWWHTKWADDIQHEYVAYAMKELSEPHPFNNYKYTYCFDCMCVRLKKGSGPLSIVTPLKQSIGNWLCPHYCTIVLLPVQTEEIFYFWLRLILYLYTSIASIRSHFHLIKSFPSQFICQTVFSTSRTEQITPLCHCILTLSYSALSTLTINGPTLSPVSFWDTRKKKSYPDDTNEWLVCK